MIPGEYLGQFREKMPRSNKDVVNIVTKAINAFRDNKLSEKQLSRLNALSADEMLFHLRIWSSEQVADISADDARKTAAAYLNATGADVKAEDLKIGGVYFLQAARFPNVEFSVIRIIGETLLEIRSCSRAKYSLDEDTLADYYENFKPHYRSQDVEAIADAVAKKFVEQEEQLAELLGGDVKFPVKPAYGGAVESGCEKLDNQIVSTRQLLSFLLSLFSEFGFFDNYTRTVRCDDWLSSIVWLPLPQFGLGDFFTTRSVPSSFAYIRTAITHALTSRVDKNDLESLTKLGLLVPVDEFDWAEHPTGFNKPPVVDNLTVTPAFLSLILFKLGSDHQELLFRKEGVEEDGE